MSSSNPSTQGSMQKRRQKDCKGQRRRRISRKQHLPIEMIDAGTPRPCQQAQDLHRVKPDKTPAPSRSKHQVPPLAEMLWVISTFWERENKCSPVESHKDTSEQLSCPEVSGQHKTDSMMFVSFWSWFVICSFYCFVCLGLY